MKTNGFHWFSSIFTILAEFSEKYATSNQLWESKNELLINGNVFYPCGKYVSGRFTTIFISYVQNQICSWRVTFAIFQRISLLAMCGFRIWAGGTTVGPTVGCLCHPGPSFLIARCKSGVPTVQKSQGRKWDIQRTESGARVLFAEDLNIIRT